MARCRRSKPLEAIRAAGPGSLNRGFPAGSAACHGEFACPTSRVRPPAPAARKASTQAAATAPPTRAHRPTSSPATPGRGAATGPKIRPKNGLDRYFEISARRSTVGREIRGGVTTFFTMAYIVVLNPIILSGADVSGNELPFPGVAAVTALIAGVMTILMGVVGRYPFALATGLGINAVVAVYAFTELTWPEIMGLVVLEGLLITVLVLTGFRRAVFEAIPPQLKTAIAVGIGFFLTIIGLVDAGFIRRAQEGVVPDLLRHQRPARRLADPGLRLRPAADERAGRAPRQGRAADRHRRHDDLRDDRGGGREGRAHVHGRRHQPARLGAAGADPARRAS